MLEMYISHEITRTTINIKPAASARLAYQQLFLCKCLEVAFSSKGYVVFEVIFHLQTNRGRLLMTYKLRLSSILGAIHLNEGNVEYQKSLV